jgi:hypothetical protein
MVVCLGRYDPNPAFRNGVCLFLPSRRKIDEYYLTPVQLAAKMKLNAPYAHTFLEIVSVRWGTAAHLIFMFFG